MCVCEDWRMNDKIKQIELLKKPPPSDTLRYMHLYNACTMIHADYVNIDLLLTVFAYIKKNI